MLAIKFVTKEPFKGFNINCYGHDCMSDFYPKGPAKNGTVLGKAYQEPHPQPWFGQVTPLVEYKIGDGKTGNLSSKIYEYLTGIQYGKVKDPYGWMDKVV